MTFASTFNLWSIAGIVYALAGAALLCNAVFAIPSGFLYAASAGEPLARDAARRLNGQWLDMRVGSSLLVIGFFLQMTGALGTASLNVPGIFVLLALALFAGYYALAKDLIADRLVNSQVETEIKLLAPPARAAGLDAQTAPGNPPAAPAPAAGPAVSPAAAAHVDKKVEAKADSAA